MFQKKKEANIRIDWKLKLLVNYKKSFCLVITYQNGQKKVIATWFCAKKIKESVNKIEYWLMKMAEVEEWEK